MSLPLTRKRILITGANTGIGYEVARKLAQIDAIVVLGCRDARRGKTAKARLLAEIPQAQIELALIDLASLASVRRFAEAEVAGRNPLHLLINNAGVMGPPKRRETTDGFELQFGTNVLGHFLLTALLMPALESAALTSGDYSRVITLSSIAHKSGRLNFDDLQSLRRYSPFGAYQQSKLANLMFALELNRRLKGASSRIISLGAHPGVADTDLFTTGEHSPFEKKLRHLFRRFIAAGFNSAADGALSTVYAATSARVQGGGYYGPQGFWEMRGRTTGEAYVSKQARDEIAAARLWETCEELTKTWFRPSLVTI